MKLRIESDGFKMVGAPPVDLVQALERHGILVTTKKRRASFVEPDGFFLRVLFHLIRRFVTDESKIAEFTRNWNCLWRVSLKPSNGPVLPGRWRDRKAAIAEEVRVINAEYL